ncbi:MAG: hypothetical protein VB835_01275 [Pirellulales bacterium]
MRLPKQPAGLWPALLCGVTVILQNGCGSSADNRDRPRLAKQGDAEGRSDKKSADVQAGRKQPRQLGRGLPVKDAWQQAADRSQDDANKPANEAVRGELDRAPLQVDFINPKLLQAAGLRLIRSKHLVLVTDLPPSADVDSLPAAFDKAVPLWAQYFGVGDKVWRAFRMEGHLMKEQAAFRKIGLFPADLPRFKNGYTMGAEFWINEQEAAYYRRHLMLHEGVHGFMLAVYGGFGPPWYMEGMAELLATHKLEDGQLVLPYYPRDKQEVPLLGRIRIVQDAVAARKGMRLRQILDYPPRAHLQSNEPYGWSWAATCFLDSHPRYRERFRNLIDNISDKDFNQSLREAFAGDWRQLSEEWLIFMMGIEHDYDFHRTAVVYADGRPLPTDGHRVKIAADRAWQSSGVQLQAGKTYRLRANGRYQIAEQPAGRIWWCEPGGVTIRYYKGHPLGKLLAAVRADRPGDSDSITSLIAPAPIGLEAVIQPEQTGTLYLRINDSGAELTDNAGKLDVLVTLADEL